MIQPGATLGQYHITALLGAGGMGQVWRARDVQLGREVAIKTLPAAFAGDAQRLARFEREARLLATLNHPNIAAVYGFDHYGDDRFLVMELVEGHTLADRLLAGPVPVDTALHIARQLADALEAAHGKDVIHRDLKPANIKLTPEGRVKVLDFGLAKAIGGETGTASVLHSPTLSVAATEAGMILGTAAYMSPEQARGIEVDRRSDVWAFGCVLYELLTGRRAFDGEDVSSVLAAVIRGEPDWECLPATLSPAVRLYLKRCLAKDPRERVQAMGDLRLALSGAFDIEATAASHAALQARPRTVPLVTAVTAALLIAAAATGLLVWNARPDPIPPTVARFTVALSAEQTWRNPARNIVAISRDGRQLAYNTNRGIYVRRLEEIGGLVVPGTEGIVESHEFSPDGQWLAYFDAAAGALKKVRLTGGQPVTLCPAQSPRGLHWTDDGFLLFAQADGIARVADRGGTPTLVVEASDDQLLRNPQALPDGSILYTERSESGSAIFVASPSGGARTELFDGDGAVYLPSGHLVYLANAFGMDGGRRLAVRRFDPESRRVGEPVTTEESVSTFVGATQFAISPAGTLAYPAGLADVAAARTVPAIVDLRGNVEPLPIPPGNYRGPRVSPDGSRLALELIDDNARSSIWIHDLDGARSARRILGARNDARPHWAPDGTRIAFASDREGPWGVYWQRLDGSVAAQRLALASGSAQYWPESWSPADAQMLLFSEVVGSSSQLRTPMLRFVRVDESGTPAAPQVLIDNQAGGASLSPNAKWLAYRNNTGESVGQILVEPFPATGERHVVTEAGGSYPVWSADGRFLYYRRSASGPVTPLTIGRLEVSPGAEFAWGNESVLSVPGGVAFFGYRDFDLMPDGERLVALVDEGRAGTAATTPPPIVVVTNWLEIIRERIPAQ